MSGSYFLRVANNSGAAVAGIPNGSQGLFSEPNFSVQFSGLTLRGANTSTIAGSTPGVKARISLVNVISQGAAVAWANFAPTATLTAELGHLDNDGYFTAYFSS